MSVKPHCTESILGNGVPVPLSKTAFSSKFLGFQNAILSI
jgi:hypothetical protein